MLECEPGAYRIQLKYGVDNYDIKMYLKKHQSWWSSADMFDVPEQTWTIAHTIFN